MGRHVSSPTVSQDRFGGGVCAPACARSNTRKNALIAFAVCSTQKKGIAKLPSDLHLCQNKTQRSKAGMYPHPDASRYIIDHGKNRGNRGNGGETGKTRGGGGSGGKRGKRRKHGERGGGGGGEVRYPFPGCFLGASVAVQCLSVRVRWV